MLSDFGLGLIIPAALLCVAGWCVPRWLGRRYADSLAKLAAVGCVAAFLLYLIAAALFAGLYVAQGAPVSAVATLGIGYFLGLGSASALIWAPMLLVSLIGLDKRSRMETW